MTQGRKLLVIKPDHVLDIITNSSSELFVLEAETQSIVCKMIEEVYPSYKNEYEEPKNIRELTLDELNQFVYYHCSPNMSPSEDKSLYPLLPGYTFDEIYEENPERWGYKYKVKNNIPFDERDGFYHSDFVTEENKEDFLSRVCPNSNWFFMYSLDENPNWEYQEKLMEIGERYHLG